MKKLLLLMVSVSLSLFPLSVAHASTKANALVKIFQSFQTNNNKLLSDLEQNFSTATDSLDAILAEATKIAGDTYGQEILLATNTFSPQIDAANKAAQFAKTLYEGNNKVRLTVSDQSANFAQWTFLDCTPPRNGILKRYCSPVSGVPIFSEGGYGGDYWGMDDISTISLNNVSNGSVDIALAKGYLVALNPIAFDTGRIDYKKEIGNAAALTTRYGNARTTAQDKFASAVSSEQARRDSSYAELTSTYNSNKEILGEKTAAVEQAILAAKRSSQGTLSVDKAFSTALKFEYNRLNLNQLADSPWTALYSFRAINNLFKVTQLADQADSIASHYSYASANSLNLTLGNVFVKDLVFQAQTKMINSIYSKATNSTIKLL